MKAWKAFRDRMKRLRQKLSRTQAAQSAFAWFVAAYIRLIYFTSRKQFICHPDSLPYYSGEKNAIFAFWHGRMILVPPYKPKSRPMHVLISHHNDGELIAQSLEYFGLGTVRGSSSSGGSRAIREVQRLFKKGANIAITPDGPRGPNREVQPGVAYLARLCKTSVIPVSFAAVRYKELRSWDRMMIPTPFNRFAMCVGAPLHLDLEAKADETTTLQEREIIKQALNAVTQEAENAVCS